MFVNNITSNNISNLLISTYNEDWIAHFEKINKILLKLLGGITISIEHVGSTAVAGLSAKPIIDIDIIYNELVDFDFIKNKLISFGYYHNGNQGVAGREVFKRTGKTEDEVLDKINHHLYVCRYDCPELHRHILFRNYLRKYPIASEFYGQLKYEIAKETKNDRKLYASNKELKANSFINYIVELSKKEHPQFGKIEG